jgi:hypothetical protein
MFFSSVFLHSCFICLCEWWWKEEVKCFFSYFFWLNFWGLRFFLFIFFFYFFHSSLDNRQHWWWWWRWHNNTIPTTWKSHIKMKKHDYCEEKKKIHKLNYEIKKTMTREMSIEWSQIHVLNFWSFFLILIFEWMW